MSVGDMLMTHVSKYLHSIFIFYIIQKLSLILYVINNDNYIK
jgi:hypothetical protein